MISNEQALCIKFKKSIGPIAMLNFRNTTTVNAHRMLGADAQQQIHKILSKRLNELGSLKKAGEQISQARKIQRALISKLNIPGLNQTMKEAIEQYSACLSAWADGADLGNFRHALLPILVKHSFVSALDLATFLQEDEVGCQTGTYRERNGGVILWHMEEDVEESEGQRFDKLRLFSFPAANASFATGFIYPDLLPGPAFGWQGGDFAQAIDTLHIKTVNFEQGILPNTLAWISLYLGAQVTRRELVEKLGPFFGGYSLTAVTKKNEKAEVEKVEFANNQVQYTELDETAGCYLFQTNIVSNLSLPIGKQEKTSVESRAWNEKRLERTRRFMRVVQQCTEAYPIIVRMLRSKLGGESAYANHDVKGYFIYQMKKDQASIEVGAGAPTINDTLITFEA